MRRLTCISVIFIGILTLTASAFAAPSKEESDLLAVREAVWRNWFAANIPALEKLVPKNTIAISTGEEKWQNQAEIFAEAKQFQASGGKLIQLEFPHTAIQRFGNVAVLYSSYSYEIETNGKHSTASGRATEVFVFADGHWTNPGWHTDSEK